MRRFYFHLRTKDAYERDEVGSEHTDLNGAYLEAFEAAQELSIDLIRQNLRPGAYRFDVCDDQDRILMQIPFAEVLGNAASFPEIRESHTRGRELIREVHDEIVRSRAELSTLFGALRKI